MLLHRRRPPDSSSRPGPYYALRAHCAGSQCGLLLHFVRVRNCCLYLSSLLDEKLGKARVSVLFSNGHTMSS